MNSNVNITHQFNFFASILDYAHIAN